MTDWRTSETERAATTEAVVTLTVGSLFAGIGGFDLAAASLGWRTVWVSEIDPFACAALAHHFPDAPNLGDVTRVRWPLEVDADIPKVTEAQEPARVDILTGGFP